MPEHDAEKDVTLEAHTDPGSNATASAVRNWKVPSPSAAKGTKEWQAETEVAIWRTRVTDQLAEMDEQGTRRFNTLVKLIEAGNKGATARFVELMFEDPKRLGIVCGTVCVLAAIIYGASFSGYGFAVGDAEGAEVVATDGILIRDEAPETP